MWNHDRELMLMNLHALGLGPSAIASRMGGGITRAAVVNKLHAMKLPCSVAPIPEPKREKFKASASDHPKPISLPMIPRSRVLEGC